MVKMAKIIFPKNFQVTFWPKKAISGNLTKKAE